MLIIKVAETDSFFSINIRYGHNVDFISYFFAN